MLVAITKSRCTWVFECFCVIVLNVSKSLWVLKWKFVWTLSVHFGICDIFQCPRLWEWSGSPEATCCWLVSEAAVARAWRAWPHTCVNTPLSRLKSPSTTERSNSETVSLCVCFPTESTSFLTLLPWSTHPPVGTINKTMSFCHGIGRHANCYDLAVVCYGRYQKATVTYTFSNNEEAQRLELKSFQDDVSRQQNSATIYLWKDQNYFNCQVLS